MSPTEPCPTCGNDRHRWDDEPRQQRCMECRMEYIEHHNLVLEEAETPIGAEEEETE